MGRTNFAPTARTIIVGLLGTSGTIFSDTIGIIAYVAATVVLLLGMVFRGI